MGKALVPEPEKSGVALWSYFTLIINEQLFKKLLIRPLLQQMRWRYQHPIDRTAPEGRNEVKKALHYAVELDVEPHQLHRSSTGPVDPQTG